MKIDTTINVTDNNTALLRSSAKKLDISINELTIRLIIKFINKKNADFKTFQRISYQKKKDSENWNRIHVWLSSEFYEKCLELRKFCKLSLSFILSLAIKLFLKDVLEKVTDNYQHNYLCKYADIDGCRMFTIAWEYPGEENMSKIQAISMLM